MGTQTIAQIRLLNGSWSTEPQCSLGVQGEEGRCPMGRGEEGLARQADNGLGRWQMSTAVRF